MESELDLPEKNIDQWVLPLDEYKPTIWQDIEWAYADMLLTGPCMRDRGIEWDVPYRDLSVRRSTSNAVGVRIFNEQIARTWGYQVEPLNLPNQDAWEAFEAHTASFSESEVSALRECQQLVTEEHLPLTDELTNFVGALAMEASARADQDEAVFDAERRWRSCMAPLGISDLPLDPSQMPSASQLAAWGIARGLDGPPTTTPPSADQLAAAVSDFECRVSSGWYETRYAAEWDAQVDLVTEFQDQLIRNRDRVNEIAQDVTSIITKNAPISE